MSVDFTKLKEPFQPLDIEWRVQQASAVGAKPWALVLAYITSRAVQDRLDTVAGPEKWKNEYTKGPDGGVLCGISIKVGDEWVTKFDGADNTNIEATKGGLSSSMKRAAVQWGIGRYLYDVESSFVSMTKNKPADMTGWHKHYEPKTKENFFWKPPELPDWAKPPRDIPDAAQLPSKEQIELIRELAAKQGFRGELLEARIDEIITSEDAEQAIKILNGDK